MSLDLGTLTGYLELDDKKLDGVLDNLPGKLKAGGVASKLAAGLLAVGIGSALVDGVTQAIDMEAANSKLTAQLGLSASESERLGGIAGKLYSQAYGDSVESVNSVVSNVVTSIEGMRGATAETVEKMTADVLNFGATFEADTGRVTQVIGQMMKSGLAKDADTAMDLLTASFQRVPAALREDVMDAIDEYGPMFTQLGISGETAMGMLVDASAKGMYGIDKTGDALKEFTIRSTDMSTASVAAYEAVGLNANDMANKVLAGGQSASEALYMTAQGLLEIPDPAARANAAIALFGTPLEDLSTSDIPKFLESLTSAGKGMEGFEGSADRMGEAINGNAKTSWTQLSRTWEQIIGQVGGALLPILSELMTFLNENPAVLEMVAAGVGILTAGFIGLTVATWAMNTALLANPITWIILGIVALIAAVVLLATHWDEVVAWISDVWGGFVGWLTGVMDGLLGWWGGVWDGFLGFLSDAWGNIVSFAEDALGFLMDLFINTNPVLWLMVHWQEVLDFLATVPGMIGDFFAGVGEWLLEAGMNLLRGLATGIAAGFIAIHYLFTEFPGQVAEWLAGAYEWLIQTGVDLLLGLYNGAMTAWANFSAWFTALPGVIAGFFIGIAEWLIQTGTDLLEGLRVGVTTSWENLVAWFVALPGVVVGFFITAVTWLATAGTNLVTGLLNAIVSTWQNVVAFFVSIPGKVIGFLAAAGTWLVTSGRNMIDGLIRGVNDMWGQFTSWLASIPGAVMQGFVNIGSWLYNSGRDLVNGLLNGVKSLAGSIGRFFLNLLPDWIVGPFKAALGIHSPSTVFYEYGQNTVQGYLNAVSDMKNEVADEMAGLVDVPPVDASVAAGRWGARAAGMSAESEKAPMSVDASLTIQGNVGWSREEVEAERRDRQRNASVAAGIDGLVGV